MSEPVGLALIGCGGMMNAHVRGLEQLSQQGIHPFYIAAACDVSREYAEAIAAKVAAWQGAPPTVYTDIDAMLAAEPGIEAVDISVQHDRHHGAALPCIAAGKHVLIEKPLAMTLRAGRAIMEAAEKAGILLAVAENYRRSPEERAIRHAIQTGRIGELRQLYWIDVGETLGAWGWRDQVDVAGGGWTMDGGVHFADLFRFHVGPVATLSAISRRQSPTRYANPETLEGPVEATVEDCTMAVLTFENGVLGTWISSRSAPGAGFGSRVVYGDRGSITWGVGLQSRTETVSIADLTAEYMAQVPADEAERLFPGGVTDTVATELAEFAAAVRGSGSVETDAMEGYRALAISLAVYESDVLGAPVRLADVESLAVETYQNRFNRMLGLA